MEKLTVVFSIGALYGGGSERQIVSLLQTLDRDRFNPRLYLINRCGPLLEQVPADVPIDVFEERYHRRPFYFPGYMHRQRVQDMSGYLRDVRADVCYDRTFLMTLIAADAAQRIGVPNVSTIVTDPSRGFAPVAGRFQSAKRKRLAKLYANSAEVLAVSHGAADSAAEFYGISRQGIRTAWNGVNIERIRELAAQSIDDAWWNAPPQNGKRLFRIVSAGRLNREKGFHVLIESVAALIQQREELDVRLAILGEGANRDSLAQQIQAADCADAMRLVGFQTAAPAWYAAADAFVLASFIEGMPNVLLEAMAVDTPVISTDCPSGPREILEDSQYGRLVKVGRAADITTALNQMANAETSSIAQQTQRARTRVETEFSIEVATRRLEQIFRDVSAGLPSPNRNSNSC